MHRRGAHLLGNPAARGILPARGPGEVILGTVADAVGLTRTAIYKYFASRDDILRRIVDDSFRDWLGAVANAVDAAADPPGKLDAYVETTLAFEPMAPTASRCSPAVRRAMTNPAPTSLSTTAG